MSQTLQQLNEDHANIERLLVLLEGELEVFHRGDAPDYGLMVDIMQYMSNYPDLFHHPREDLIFARLADRDPGTRTVVDSLTAEHERLLDDAGRFLELLRTVMNEHMVERDALESLGREYVALLRHHMEVEEGQLFPRASQVLSEADWSEVDVAMGAMEDPLFGAVVEKEYLALCDHIKHQGSG